jgi:hypothetical protein
MENSILLKVMAPGRCEPETGECRCGSTTYSEYVVETKTIRRCSACAGTRVVVWWWCVPTPPEPGALVHFFGGAARVMAARAANPDGPALAVV